MASISRKEGRMKKRLGAVLFGIALGITIIAFGKQTYQYRLEYPMDDKYPAQWNIVSLTSWFEPERDPNQFVTVQTGILIGYQNSMQCWLGTSDGMSDCQNDILLFVVFGNGKKSYQINLFYFISHEQKDKENGFLKGY
jgi:hypothetical protein